MFYPEVTRQSKVHFYSQFPTYKMGMKLALWIANSPIQPKSPCGNATAPTQATVHPVHFWLLEVYLA